MIRIALALLIAAMSAAIHSQEFEESSTEIEYKRAALDLIAEIEKELELRYINKCL